MCSISVAFQEVSPIFHFVEIALKLLRQFLAVGKRDDGIVFSSNNRPPDSR